MKHQLFFDDINRSISFGKDIFHLWVLFNSKSAVLVDSILQGLKKKTYTNVSLITVFMLKLKSEKKKKHFEKLLKTH